MAIIDCMRQVIMMRTDAPPKPAEGSACNGCGVCCAYAPCPIGQIVSRRRTGACAALEWADDGSRYVCGLVASPERHLPPALRSLAPLLGGMAQRMIASGIGCDSDITVEPVAPH